MLGISRSNAGIECKYTALDSVSVSQESRLTLDKYLFNLKQVINISYNTQKM